MVMDIDARCDRRSVEGGRLKVPPAERGFDFFVDAVADRLHDLGFYDAALGVDGHGNDYVAHQIFRELSPVDRRIRVYG